MEKDHVYMWLHTALTKTTVGNKTKFFHTSFHVSTSSCLTVEGAFRNDYVAACGTALHTATEENESGGYVTVPCLFEVKQHSSTADWL